MAKTPLGGGAEKGVRAVTEALVLGYKSWRLDANFAVREVKMLEGENERMTGGGGRGRAQLSERNLSGETQVYHQKNESPRRSGARETHEKIDYPTEGRGKISSGRLPFCSTIGSG